jgi:hypothetical protein
MDNGSQRYDVTSPEARKVALVTALFPPWWVNLIPGGYLGWVAWRFAQLYSADSTAREVESQRRTAVEIIKAGKDRGVAELEITVSEQAGIGLGSSVEGFPIQFNAGTQGNMTIKVKYK